MNPRNADYRDLKVAPDDARTTIVLGLRLQTVYLVVRKMAPLAELAPFSGAPM